MKNIKKHLGLLAGTLAITTGVYGGKSEEPRKPEDKKHTETKPRAQTTNSNPNTNSHQFINIPVDFLKQLNERIQSLENQTKQLSNLNNTNNNASLGIPKPLQSIMQIPLNQFMNIKSYTHQKPL